MPTVEVPEITASPALPPAPQAPQNPAATPASPPQPPVATDAGALVPVSASCLLGTDSAGGCSGADTARDLAPAGLLALGALALLGSGSFLESLRGSLRG
ncbi:hypothetical protein BFL43_10440 [Williamsia sp. 1135]|nr:hypothetical protein BFL43_10440 [Williamsia sp. 1135]